MKIFINGAAGYVGARLVRHLACEHKVTACDIVPMEEIPCVDFISAEPEVSKQDWVGMLSGHDVVVNLAQYPGYKDFPDKAEEIFETNTRLALKILDAARLSDLKSAILFSSGGIYGLGKEKFHELDKLNPLDFYLATKAMSELIARKYRPFFGVHIVRPFFIYGPSQRGKLIPNLIERVKMGLPVFINGKEDGGSINPIYIDDVIKLTDSLLKIIPGSATVNFAGPDVVSIRQIIEMIGEITGIRPVVERKEESPAFDIVADIARIAQISDISLKPFREGLIETIEGGEGRCQVLQRGNRVKEGRTQKELYH